MDRRVTPPKRVTSPIWGTPPPCKKAVSSACARTNVILAGKCGSRRQSTANFSENERECSSGENKSSKC